MSKICRTCLQRTNRTFRTSQPLGNFGEGSIRISVVLRFFIPELYLGLSSNPEICFSCKENLKVAYLFKKKCLDTENIIGNYLKDVRCTGKSVDLHDVLAYINDELKSPVLIQEKPSNNIVSVQNSANKLEGPIECDPVNNENPQVVDVQKSAPNPTHQGNVINFSECQNLVVNQIKLLSIIQNENDRNHDSSQAVSDVQAQFVVTQNESESLHDEDEANNFCKISNVYSLNPDAENTNKTNYETTNVDNDTDTETRMDIKDEPLDIDLNENFNYTGTDEETLDASETASFKNHCSPSLQEFIDSIPEISHPDQYVDIPDFVTINNFGFKELEEFKLQQVADQTNSKSDKITSEATPNLVDLNKNNTLTEGVKPEMKVVKVLASAPDVIILNGKRMVKYGNQYKLEEEGSAAGENLKQNIAQGVQTKTLIASNRKRNKRKIKIVPVSEQQAEKKLKLDSNSLVKLPKTEEKEVVVLFTNYTSEGDYINDHDYLISPYKRNKVLIEENSAWLCICFICNTRHDVYDHVGHMKTHGTRCMVCSSDLGTPYMLNIHYKTHRKPCRYCTEVVPYGVIKSHEQKHIAEENEIIENSKKRGYWARKGRKKLQKDEKPVYFQLPKQEGNNVEKSDESQSEGSIKTVIPEVKCESRINDSEDSDCIKKRGRPRRKPDTENISEIVESPRTLRTRVKRWYVESDEEGESNKAVPSDSKGTVSDSKEEEN